MDSPSKPSCTLAIRGETDIPHKIKDAAAKEEEAAPEAPKGPTAEELLAEIRDALKAQA